MPLAMAIAFSMITSYLLAQTFVPIMANWLMKEHHAPGVSDAEEYAASAASHYSEKDTWDQKKILIEKAGFFQDLTRFEKFRNRFLRFMARLLPYRIPIVLVYSIIHIGGVPCCYSTYRP